MKTINIQAAKTHLSRLVEEAVSGEDIILAKSGRPMVRLTPCANPLHPRKLGLLRGRIQENPHCWDTDPCIVAEFENNALLPNDRHHKKP